VGEIARAIAETLGRLHPQRTIELDVPPDLAFRGAREDLEEIVGNLLENACQWARRLVRLQARRAHERLWLTVEDDGAGLDPAACEAVVARGTRLDERAPGSGLGLAIVQEVIQLHGGVLRLDRSPLGGLRATIEAPAAGPSAGEPRS
jgi:signal transduction histidine kinase